MHILYIEDNEDDWVMLEDELATNGSTFCELDWQPSLEKGLAQVQMYRYDAVLLDLGLPDSNGLQAVEKLHALHADVPIIVLTGNDDQALGAKAVAMGAQDFLVKGRVNADLLLKSITFANIRHKLDQSLKNQTQELQRSNEDLQQFAYAISHDLQAPLRHIATFAGFLEEENEGKLDEQSQMFIAQIVSSAKRMNVLISDLLEFSRYGNEKMQRQPVALDTLLGEALDLLKQEIDDQEATITVSGKLPTVPITREILLPVFQNLIQNALHYRQADTPPHITIRADRDDSGHTLSFQDNGIGIEPKYAEKIFGMFTRLSADSSGTGIGLALCKKNVERHGGKIWVDSHPGQGSTFNFTLPHIH